MTAMRFRNFGGIHQFVVTDAEDLSRIDDLDPARWAATSAPIADLHCDPDFLKYMDPETSGRIRVSQLITARDWAFARLSRKDVFKGRSGVVPLDAISAEEAGKKLRAAAERINREQKVQDDKVIALPDVRAFKAGYSKLLANGDGVVPPELIPEPVVADFVKDIVALTGGAPDRGGSLGVGKEHLDRFTDKANAWLAWVARTDTVSVWGADTDAAAALVTSLDDRIENYFLHAEVLRQERPSADSLRMKEDDFRALRARNTAALQTALADAPLATPDPSGALDLNAAINAVYRASFADLRTKVLARVLGADVSALTREGWLKVKATLEPYIAWQKDKPAEKFGDHGAEKIRGLLQGPLAARVEHFIALDKSAAAELDQIDDLEKLLLFVRGLVELANNFVNFSSVYRPTETALVEMGSFVIDGRRLDFCLKVVDRTAHKAVAAESLIYLVYARVSEKEGGAVLYEIVAPVTGGERGRLRVGKRGIFIDLSGKELDAQIVEILENPISVKEAMFAPFRRLSQMVSRKIEEWVGSAATAQEGALTAQAESGVAGAQSAVEGAPAAATAAPAPAAATPRATEAREGLNMNTLILGGSVALAGVSALFGSVIAMLIVPTGWYAILGVVLAVLSVSALLGWLKLRRRDMSLLFEAGGWAVNVHMKITARVARVFSFVPDLPKDAVLDRTDMLPPAEGEGRGARIVTTVLFLGVAAAAAFWYFKLRHR